MKINCSIEEASSNLAPAFGVRGLDPALTFGGSGFLSLAILQRSSTRVRPACDDLPTPDVQTLGRKSGVKPPHSKASRHLESCIRFKLVIHFNRVGFERVDRFYMPWVCIQFEPSCRAPRILIRHWNQPMTHRILMHVIQARKIALFVSQSRVPVVVPVRAPRRVVEFVDESRSGGVKLRHKRAQTSRIRIGRRRFSDKMNVIREHRPRLKSPAVFLRQREELIVNELQPLPSAKSVRLQISAASEKKGPALSQSMFWSMGPRYFVRRHNLRVSELRDEYKPLYECREALEPKVVPPSFLHLQAQCGCLTPLFLPQDYASRVEQLPKADLRVTVVLLTAPVPPKVKAGSSPRTPKPRGSHYAFSQNGLS